MKKNINEEVSRIKQMMGLNEETINLDGYNDESSIVEDIKRVGTTEDGHPITSMKLNTYIPSTESNAVGQKVKVEVILEWKPDVSTQYKNRYVLKKVSSIITDVGLGEELMKKLKVLFAANPHPYDMISAIYRPYVSHSLDKSKEYRDKILDNIDKDNDALLGVLTGKVSQQVEPEVQDVPKPEKPKDKGSDMWTSTTSW